MPVDPDTQPMQEPSLWRVSAFQRAMGTLAEMDHPGPATQGLTSLSPSLLDDLERVDAGGAKADILEVIAACLRHVQNAALHLARDGFVLPITVFPRERLYHCPLQPESLLTPRLRELKLLQLEPAILRPPGNSRTELVAESHRYHALPPLLWALAIHGPRSTLLPEIAGPAVYRIAPGLDLRRLDIKGPIQHGIYRMREAAVPLRTIAAWPGFNEELAIRMLNGLYLQSGLIVSRTHPSALSATTLAQSWRQLIRRRKDGS